MKNLTKVFFIFIFILIKSFIYGEVYDGLSWGDNLDKVSNKYLNMSKNFLKSNNEEEVYSVFYLNEDIDQIDLFFIENKLFKILIEYNKFNFGIDKLHKLFNFLNEKYYKAEMLEIKGDKYFGNKAIWRNNETEIVLKGIDILDENDNQIDTELNCEYTFIE